MATVENKIYNILVGENYTVTKLISDAFTIYYWIG